MSSPMNPDELFRRYGELRQYVGWTEQDAQRVQAVASILEPHLQTLVDDFYEEIGRHPEARVTGGAERWTR